MTNDSPANNSDLYNALNPDSEPDADCDTSFAFCQNDGEVVCPKNKGTAVNDAAEQRTCTEMTIPQLVAVPKQCFESQSLGDFLNKEFPPKEPLIDGLLYSRDLVSFTGRRRNGKTTFLCNLAIASAGHAPHFMGYAIPRPMRVLCLFLEDDARELQDKMRPMIAAVSDAVRDRMHIYTRDDLLKREVRIDIKNKEFIDFIEQSARAAQPDIIILDNLGQFIGANYNDAPMIHAFVKLLFTLQERCNAAVITAAHPRKSGSEPPDMVKMSESFFEECMGSSHFINSTGSLWGIQRNRESGITHFIGGSQRVTGEQGIAILEKDDDNWFHVISDYHANLELANSTTQRKKAWTLLPESFSYGEGVRSVKSALSSKSSFSAWFNELVRLSLVIPRTNGYDKAKPQGVGSLIQ